MWKKILLISFLLCTSIILTSPYFISRNREFPELWDAPIRIMDSDWEEPWLKGKGGQTYRGCISVSNKIYSRIRTNSSEFFSEIYVNHIPNKYENIVYLSLTDISPETTGKVLDLLNPPQGTYIEFIKAPAPLSKVEEWMQELEELWPFMWSRGVHLNSLNLAPNGTILLGLENVTQEQIDMLILTIEGRVPPGILVVHESEGLIEQTGEETFVTLEGMLSQEDSPDHDWNKDPVGPKVLSLDVLDPENTLDYETYYLNSRNGEFYIFFPLSRRINDSIWVYRGPKPVKITGIQSYHVGLNEKVVDTLRIFHIEYSVLGSWYEGVLGIKEVELGLYRLHNRLYQGLKRTILSLTLDTPLPDSQNNEVLLASHEGYIYNVPCCGTGQPVADYNTGQSVRIRGLLTEIVDSKKQVFSVLMIFEIQSG